MLVNFKDILTAAYNNQYAIGSFNGYNYETFKGIIDAGVEAKTPVILAFGAKYLKNMPLETACVLARSLADTINSPVCLHLDHASSMDTVFKAIRAGFNSVMYDGSALPFAENIKNTKAICEAAHASGVSVEAELGCLAAGECSHEGSDQDQEIYTDPKAAKEFAEVTGVDALAVSIGTVHGLYKGKPNLRIDILDDINRRLAIPLVLHGGSGLTKDDILVCIKSGIAKINVNTEISVYTVARTVELLKSTEPHFSELSLHQTEFVKDVVKKYISFFGRSA